jgi:hypothetical protein
MNSERTTAPRCPMVHPMGKFADAHHPAAGFASIEPRYLAETSEGGRGAKTLGRLEVLPLLV